MLLKRTKQSISCLSQEEMTSVHVSLSFILDSAKSQQFPKSSSAIFVLLLPQACVVPSFPVLGYSYKDALSGVAKKYFHQVILNISSIISFLCHQLVHSNLIFLNKSCKCYVLYASATVIQHFIFCRLKAIFFKCRNARSNIIPKTLIWHFFFFKRVKTKNSNTRSLRNGSVSVLFLQRTLQTLHRSQRPGRGRPWRSSTSHSPANTVLSPIQSRSSTRLAPGLKGTPPVSCQMTCMPSALLGNRNLEPFCTCRVLGTVGTQRLTAPWRGAKPSGTPSPTLQAAGQLRARRQPSCDYAAMFFKAQFGHDSNCL